MPAIGSFGELWLGSEHRSAFRGSARALPLFLLGLPFHRANSPAGFDGLRFLALLDLLCAQAQKFVIFLTRKWLLESVEELSGRIDLVVVLAVGKDGQLVQVLREPRRRVRHPDKAVLDHRGLRVHAHDLVGLRLLAGDRVEALAD